MYTQKVITMPKYTKRVNPKNVPVRLKCFVFHTGGGVPVGMYIYGGHGMIHKIFKSK